MKSTWYNTSILLLLLSVALFACKDKGKNTVVTPPAIGGKGGLATMRVVVQHNGVNVDSGKVYIKYNTLTPPANNRYDDSGAIFMVDGTPMAIFTELTQGDYFIYGHGWDIIGSATVAGTRPYTITAPNKNGINLLYLQTNKQ